MVLVYHCSLEQKSFGNKIPETTNMELDNWLIMNISDIKQTMAFVEEGFFVMGCTETETSKYGYYDNADDLSNTRPQRNIFLDSFWIDKYPVTNAQYKNIIDETGHRIPLLDNKHPDEEIRVELSKYEWDSITRIYKSGLDDCPVVIVSWEDAIAYANWTGRTLPTEAQWEKAARGVEGIRFPWGNDDEVELYCQCSYMGMKFPPENYEDQDLQRGKVQDYANGVSPYGCFNMMGLVEEWCLDVYDEEFYSYMPEKNPFRSEVGIKSKSKDIYRATRGDITFARHIGSRGFCEQTWTNCATGFRCVLPLD